MARTSLMRIGITICLATAGVAYAGQDQQQAPATESVDQGPADGAFGMVRDQGPPAVLQHRNPRYQLEKGDVLELNFPYTPEFNDTVTVQPDGFVSIRVVGDLYVEGKTLPEVNEAIRIAYSKILHDPVVTILPKTFVAPYFVALGQVKSPGRYTLHGDTTVTQGLAIAGGLLSSSKHSQVLLVRRVSNDWAEVKEVNVKHMFLAKNLQEDLHLRPGDMIFVPKNKISKILEFIPLAYFARGSTGSL